MSRSTVEENSMTKLRGAKVVVTLLMALMALATSLSAASPASADPGSQGPVPAVVTATSDGGAAADEVGTQGVYGPYPYYGICYAYGVAGVAIGAWNAFTCFQAVGVPGYFLLTV
jgi:hypothetical protein